MLEEQVELGMSDLVRLSQNRVLFRNLSNQNRLIFLLSTLLSHSKSSIKDKHKSEIYNRMFHGLYGCYDSSVPYKLSISLTIYL